MTKKAELLLLAFRKRLARNVRRLRKSLGLSHAELGRRTGIYPRYLQKIEAEEANVSLKVLTRLANGLEVDPAELFKKHQR